MRFIVSSLVALSLLASGVAAAQDKPAAPPPVAAPAPPPKPQTTAQAADAVLAAVAAKDDAGLKSLAAKDDPDPWVVADELCARSQFDAAGAFAKACAGKPFEKLPSFVVAERASPTDPALRKALAARRSSRLRGPLLAHRRAVRNLVAVDPERRRLRR